MFLGISWFCILVRSSFCKIPVIGRGCTHCTDVPCQLLVASVQETKECG